MKSVVADPATRVMCSRVETVSGVIIQFANHPYDLLMSNGQVYQANPLYKATDIPSTADLTPSVFDTQGFFHVAGLTRDMVLSGVLDGARAYEFATSWADPVEDYEQVRQTIAGKARIEDEKYIIERMDLNDALNQNTGTIVLAKCTHTVFDETLSGTVIPAEESRCTGPRSNPDGPALADFRVSGTVTHVTTDNRQWRDENRAEAAGWFDRGELLWTGGDNAGLAELEIKASQADGTITTHFSPYFPVKVGDTYDAAPGCDKVRSGDCYTKYNNNINCNGCQDLTTEEDHADYTTSG